MDKARTFPAVLTVALLLTACVPAAPQDAGSAASSAGAESPDTGLVPDANGTMRTTEDSGGDGGGPGAGSTQKSGAGDARVITMTTENFTFTPSVIRVKKGEKVQLVIQGVSGVHGLAVPDMGINAPVQAGDAVTVMLDTSIAGTFAFFCSIPCGPGHQDMRGQILVEA